MLSPSLLARSLVTLLSLGALSVLSAQTPAPKPPSAGNEILDAGKSANPPPVYAPAPGFTLPPGPATLDWASIKANYHAPQWLQAAKFGIFIHWGVYTVPAHHNEWYARHMYSNGEIIKWHQEHFGPQDKFGYKDFIPLFKAEKFDPVQWAALFKESGARFVIPTAEHHDRFAMWESQLTKWNAKNMGPKRDVIGELAKAVRAEGLKYGVSNHRMFAYDFMVPQRGLKTDLYDPAYADFYGPLPDAAKTWPTQEFCNDWLARTRELIDLYHPDFLWFDWDGTGAENAVKLQFAAYYFNRASERGQDVGFTQKGITFPVGTGVPSYEKAGRAPKDTTPEFWMVDDVISNRSWSYVEGMTYRTTVSILHQLIDATAKNGALLLNISPRSDGVIPDEQQDILRGIGRWLAVNGEAIYGTRPWKKSSDGTRIRYTSKGDTLYAILLGRPGATAVLPSLVGQTPATVELLGSAGELKFNATDAGLFVTMPTDYPESLAYVIKLARLSK